MDRAARSRARCGRLDAPMITTSANGSDKRKGTQAKLFSPGPVCLRGGTAIARESNASAPESPLSRFRRKASQSRWLHDTDAMPVQRLGRITLTEPSSSRTALVPNASRASPRMSGSIESALLLKIREAKQMRTGVAPASMAPSPRRAVISPSHARLRLLTSPVNSRKKSDAAMREHLIKLVASSTSMRSTAPERRSTAQHRELIDPLDALQSDSRPLEPPIPHRKPEKPLAAVSGSPTSTCNSCGTNVAASIKTSVNEVIVAANATMMIQRAWRGRRSMQHSQTKENTAIRSPVYTIIVDKEATSATQTGNFKADRVLPESTQEENTSNEPSNQLHAEDEGFTHALEGPEQMETASGEHITLNVAALWSEDEWSFLEEGRSAGGALLDGKGEGARMDGDEFVRKFPQRVILQREAQRVAALKIVHQARKTRRNNSKQWRQQVVRSMQPGPLSETASNDQAHHPSPPTRCSRTPTDIGKTRRAFQLCRHRKVVQTGYRKRQPTHKRALVDHRRSPVNPHERSSATATLAASELVVSEEVAASTAPANDRNAALNPVASDTSATERLGSLQSTCEEAACRITTGYIPLHQFVEFVSIPPDNKLKDSIRDTGSGSRNDLIYVGDLKVAGQLLTDATLASSAPSSVVVDVNSTAIRTRADTIAESRAIDITPLSVNVQSAFRYEDTATVCHTAYGSDPTGDDEEHTLDEGELTASTRPVITAGDAFSNESKSSECFETGGQSLPQDASQLVSSLVDNASNSILCLEEQGIVVAVASGLLGSQYGDAEIASSDPLYSLMKLENTVAQTLNHIHNRIPSRGSCSSNSDVSVRSETHSDRHLSNSKSVSSVTSSDRPPTDAREQQEFRRILDDFRLYLRLSAADSTSALDSESSASPSWLLPLDEHADGHIDATDDDVELRAMASEIRQCRQRVAQSLMPWPTDH